MPNSIGNKCRICRREGVKLFLKGERCFSPKCPIDRKGAVPPGGQTGKKSRRRLSEHGQQLREKQKLRRFYEIDEKQFRGYFAKAKKSKGETAQSFIQTLESRLDNIVYRLGFVSSRRMARQIITHGHIRIDGKKVDIPSYLVKEGQTISLTAEALKIPSIADTLGKKESLPAWLERKAAVGRMKRPPAKDEIDINVDEKAVVEYYSR